MAEGLAIVLARQPSAPPVASDFRAARVAMTAPRDDEILVRTLYLSLDPYIGSVLRGRHLGERPPEVGEVIPGRGIGVVVESRSASLRSGDVVRTETGWRDLATVPATAAEKISAADAPLSAQLGVAGMPGLTAYAGIHHLAKVRPGDAVLVSSAAGAVGGAAGQIARIQGATRVVGIAGGSAKCRLVVETYGFDACIDYKTPDWKQDLAAALPGGADVYFDNVGGDVLQTAIENLALRGRVVLCGLASQYHANARPAGPNPGLYIGKRAQLFGLVVYDFASEQAAYTRLAGEWIRKGQLVAHEDRAQGLENAPTHFEKLMRGENIGKAIVVVSPEERLA